MSVVSAGHLPRLLARVEWEDAPASVLTHLGIRVESPVAGEWIAIDGKALRGSPGEQVVFARSHQSGRILAHQPLSGPKPSEVTTVRALLAQPPLAGARSPWMRAL